VYNGNGNTYVGLDVGVLEVGTPVGIEVGLLVGVAVG
jgi:hypothetical protein